MTARLKLILLLAALSATSFAKGLIPLPAAPTTKVGGGSAILAETTWQRCGRVASLEYRDESVIPGSISHDEPLYRVSLRNLLPVRRTFELAASCLRAAESHRTVVLEPMSSATVTMPLAFACENSHSYYTMFSIREPNPPAAAAVGGIPYEEIKLVNRATEYCHRSEGKPSLLLSSGITRDSILPSFKKDFDTVELRRDADEWPRDFRAYLPFDAVCIASDVKESLNDEARTALRAYELLGGTVMTMRDGASHPKDIESMSNISRDLRRGDLDVSYSGGYYYHGHSSYGNSFSENIGKVPLKVGRSLPLGLLVAFLALVAVVAAPVAVWYCATKNRRILLLAVLPGSAVALTVAVAAVALLAYGTTPTVRVQAVTILDPESRLAVTRGQFAAFSPTQVSGQMSIPQDASFRLRGRDGKGHIEVACGDAFRLEGDWIKPLTAAFFDFERAERRSERLDVKRGADGSVTVANLLGSPIACGSLQLGGVRYKIPRLAPGEQTTVSGVPFVALPEKILDAVAAEALATAFFSKSADYGRNWTKAQLTADSEKTPLPDGTYVVRLIGSPFFPSPFAGTKAYETAEAVVAGCVAPEAGKEAAK